MHSDQTALLVVDAQESFRYRPYWRYEDVPAFVGCLQSLVDGAVARNVPVVQIFHIEETGPFSTASGFVRTFEPLSIRPNAVFYKRQHSALVGSGLDVWLVSRGIRRIIVAGIRTEQCCETTTRHASDLGFSADFVTQATLTLSYDRRNRTGLERD